MADLFYPIWVDQQRFAVPVEIVVEVRRVPWAGSDISSLYTRYGRVALCDLAEWAHVPVSKAQRSVLVLLIQQRWFGVIIDQIDDAVTFNEPLLELPLLLHDASVDPSIMGVILIDTKPCLVLDLEALTLMHVPFLPDAA